MCITVSKAKVILPVSFCFYLGCHFLYKNFFVDMIYINYLAFLNEITCLNSLMIFFNKEKKEDNKIQLSVGTPYSFARNFYKMKY